MKKLLILLLTACSLFGQFKFQRSLDDRYTVLHIRGNGQNGSTIIPDVSQYGNTVTAYNGAAVSFTQNKYYGGSIYFDGSNDYISVINTTENSFSSYADIFTIDFWIYRNGVPAGAFYGIIDKFAPPNGWAIDFGNSGNVGKIRFFSYSLNLLSTNSVCDVIWHHVAVTNNGSVVKIYIDGIYNNQVAVNSDVLTVSQNISIGGDGASTYFSSFYLQNLRISRNIVRWTSNFIPPQKPEKYQ